MNCLRSSCVSTVKSPPSKASIFLLPFLACSHFLFCECSISSNPTPLPTLRRYTSLLEQFSANSYGDHLFCCFVLLPLQQRQPVSLRRLLWEEHPQVLRFLSIPPDKVCPCNINFNHYTFKIMITAPTGREVLSASQRNERKHD